MNNTDYNLYKIFLYLYEQRSISKTANLLYVSQPAISYSLKELENQLGYTLFYRNSKGIEPTMEAKELYSYVSTAFNIMKSGEEHIKSLNSLNIGCIKIGTPSHIGIFYLSSFIADFRKVYPGIKFEIISKSTADMVEMLETRKIDLIVDTLPISTTKSSVKKVTLSRLQNCFAYNKDSFPNADIKCVEDLKQYPLVLPSATSSIRGKLNEFVESKNVQLYPVFESWTTEMMIEMVRRGVGIGYFVKNVIDIQKDKDEFEVITFGDELPAVDVCAVYVEDFTTTAVNKFIEFLSSNKAGEYNE
ncbi:MAG: LysR family transcriptional regulator [Bacilli bacterium]|nr:LysR family transcriptional regulator [Bacillota bacterium]MBR6820778.1 LysR family transcriptional regulator [Bacilli bacterium]